MNLQYFNSFSFYAAAVSITGSEQKISLSARHPAVDPNGAEQTSGIKTSAGNFFFLLTLLNRRISDRKNIEFSPLREYIIE
jgi:hypothetical protein